MNAVAPLPLAPPPYRAEALYSWLRRVAATYGMRPRQLLHALGVKPFLGPAISFPDLPLEAALEPSDLRYLARLARCDPSRLGLGAPRNGPWLLACDDWIIICPQCIRMDLQAGKPAYERAVWRIATGSFCLRHRAPLVRATSLPQDIDACNSMLPAFNDLERVVLPELMEFETSIARAFDGVAPRQSMETLNAAQFLQVLNDLCTFAVEPWDTEHYRTTSSLEQHSWKLSSQCPHLFDYHRPRRNTFSRPVTQRLTLHRIADPAMRSAALWLVMQVIWLPPTPHPRHALRLGFSAQDEFFGNRPHDGWAWLTNQAQTWPAVYRAYYWEGFETAGDSFKGTNDINEGTK
jgi:hypothetical protein